MDLKIIKLIALFIAVWYTFINIYRVAHKNDISGFNIFIQAFSTTIFVWMQWID